MLLRSSSLLLRVALVGSFAARWRSLAARGAAERGGAAAAVGPAPFVPGDEVRVAFNGSEVRSALNCQLYVASRPSSGRPSELRNVILSSAMRDAKYRAFLTAVGARVASVHYETAEEEHGVAFARLVPVVRNDSVSHKDLVS